MEKTIAIQLKEHGDKIAKAIEDGSYVWLGSESNTIIVKKIINQAAEIAKDTK